MITTTIPHTQQTPARRRIVHVSTPERSGIMPEWLEKGEEPELKPLQVYFGGNNKYTEIAELHAIARYYEAHYKSLRKELGR